MILVLLIPAAGHSSDLGERELQEDLLLFINKVNPRPVHRHNHVILGQTGSCGQSVTSMKDTHSSNETQQTVFMLPTREFEGLIEA